MNGGADFNRKDSFGRTPLHYAAANCNYQCLFAMVGSGASVNDLDKRGCTPLHYAACVDVLINQGASILRFYQNRPECIAAN
uniref:Uncharacterized protein n=1 Tax=Astyanax mexicanus TaxID=7994 RepID=A0A8B9KYA1_ASTMX